MSSDPGFRADQVLTASVELPRSEYKENLRAMAFYEQVIKRVGREPGTIAAGGSTDLPLLGAWKHLFTPERREGPAGGGQNACYHSAIYGEYLRAMGIPLLRGRYFTEEDGPKSTPVLIVSEALAKKYWPGQDPLGKRLKWGTADSSDPWLTVVGVAGDVKQGPLDAAIIPHSYQPYAQLGDLVSLHIAVRGASDPESMATGLRAAVHGLDAQLALDDVRTMKQVESRSTEGRRFGVFLFGSFALVALALAAIGVYGVVAYSVTQRTNEIGVRRADVIRMVLSEGMRVTALGMLFGVAGTIAVMPLLRNLLYEIGPADPLTYSVVIFLLGGVAFLASYLPARRALQVDPMIALRYE